MKRYKQILSKPAYAIGLVVFGLVTVGGVLATAIFSRQDDILALAEQRYIRTETLEEPADYPTEVIESYAYGVGHREVKQQGSAGVKQTTYSIEADGHGNELSRTFDAQYYSVEPQKQIEIVGKRLPGALTKAKSAQHFVDSKGVSHRETYYDLPMRVVMGACGAGGKYSVREDGAKIDHEGYVIVAANYGNYPKCSIVETSMGLGRVYDTGGFALRHPHGFDLATDWTKADGI